MQYLYNNSIVANAFVPFIVSGQDGISADPASVFIVDTDIKSIPCNSNGVAKTGASLTVSAYERDTNGNMSAISPLFMQIVYYYTPNVQHGSATSSPIYQGTVSNGVKTVEIPSTMNNIGVFANKIQIDVYKNNNPTSNLIKTITLYPLLDGQQGVQGPTGEEGKPLPTMLVSTPTLGFTLAQEEYGNVVGDASVRLTALYGESSKNTIYEVWDNFQPASTSGEHWRKISSNRVTVGVRTNSFITSKYYWRFSCRVDNDTLVIKPESVDSKAINGDYNCVLKIRAKHPSYSEYITTDYCFYVVRRGQKGEARSYTPYLMGVYNENTKYVWDDKRRDFVYYPATKDGKEIYYIWGVKEYGMDFTNKTPGKTYPNDTHNEYWEQGDVYTLLVTNCIFADNAVLGGMKFTDQKMTSSDKEEKIVIDGSSGEFKANKAIIRGTIYAESGSFENAEVRETCNMYALIRSQEKVINAQNFQDYVFGEEFGWTWIDFEKVGRRVRIESLPSSVKLTFNTSSADTSKNAKLQEFFRSIVGNTILIYNESGSEIAFNGKFTESKYSPGFGSFVLKTGSMISLEAVICIYGGVETFAFEYRKGSILENSINNKNN